MAPKRGKERRIDVLPLERPRPNREPDKAPEPEKVPKRKRELVPA